MILQIIIGPQNEDARRAVREIAAERHPHRLAEFQFHAPDRFALVLLRLGELEAEGEEQICRRIY